MNWPAFLTALAPIFIALLGVGGAWYKQRQQRAAAVDDIKIEMDRGVYTRLGEENVRLYTRLQIVEEDAANQRRIATEASQRADELTIQNRAYARKNRLLEDEVQLLEDQIFTLQRQRTEAITRDRAFARKQAIEAESHIVDYDSVTTADKDQAEEN